MHQVEHSVLIEASAERVFGIYQDVAAWHTWGPDTRRASLDGPFAVGTCGSLTPTQGRTVPMRVTRVEVSRCFTVESRVPGLRMVFDHEIVPQQHGVRVTHRASFSGLLSPLLGRLLVRQLDRGLPVTLAKLRRLAQAGS